MRPGLSNSDMAARAAGGRPAGRQRDTVRRWADGGRIASRRTPSGQRRFSARRPQGGRRRGRPRGGDGLQRTTRGAEQRYQLLLETSLELASTLDSARSCSSAARRLSAALQIPDCDIYRLEGDGRMVCLASAFDGVYDASWVGHEFALDDWPCDRLAVETRRAVAVSSLDDPRLSRGRARGNAPLRPAQLRLAAPGRPRQGHRLGRLCSTTPSASSPRRRSPPPRPSASSSPWRSSTPSSTRRSSTSTSATCGR